MRPKIGLALGSGAARGLAHIGVIKVLQKNNIPIDFVSGSSIGAVVGALFCSGTPLDWVIKLLGYLKNRHIIDISISKRGLIEGKKIEDFLSLLIKKKTFEELEVPLAIVATDLEKGEKVVFSEGEIVSAIRASISIPGIFPPVVYDGKVLVDGGVVDRVPAGVARAMGADIVIGVDVGFRTGEEFRPKNIFDIIIQTVGIMEMQAVKRKNDKCDLIITPNVKNISPFSITDATESVKAGIIATEACLDKIKKLSMVVTAENDN